MPIERDIQCVKCGYNVRGLPSDAVCPECGIPIRRTLEVMANPSRSSRWVYGASIMFAMFHVLVVVVPFTRATGEGAWFAVMFDWPLFQAVQLCCGASAFIEHWILNVVILGTMMYAIAGAVVGLLLHCFWRSIFYIRMK